MQAPSKAERTGSARRLVVKLAVVTAAVAITAAVAFDRSAPTTAPSVAAIGPSAGAAPVAALASKARHAPLSETASTWVSGPPGATGPVAEATSARP